jgi:hypothetical protein
MTFLKKCAILIALNSWAVAPIFSQATGSDSAPAQTTPPPAAATPPAAPTWSIGLIDFSGTIDGYANYNTNSPQTASGSPGNNTYRNFDVKADQFALNLAKVTLNHDPDPVGFHFDFGFGEALDTIHSASDPKAFQYIEQAFLSLKPAKAKGFEADFGMFVTSAGAEVIESKDNWNYSRSFLFAWAIPYYHFGVRTSIPLSKTFTGGFQLVNGWNDIEDNNSGKTIGVTGVWTKPKFTWSGNYYTGPENTGTNKGFRNLIDTTVLLTPPGKVNAYINYDYGVNKNYNVAGFADGSSAHWQGVAGAVHIQADSKIAFTPRAEIFDDNKGFSTGVAQTLKEFTFTGEYKLAEGLLFRGEYRGDFSDQPSFLKKISGAEKNQHTLEFAFIGFFGPKR